MAKTLLVDPSLYDDVSNLTKQWKALNSSYENFAKKKIEFAAQISKVWEKAQAFDKNLKTDANQNHFREQLKAIIQSDNKSILSKWVSIGERAEDLLPYANSLPPQRDSLYALSLAVGKKKTLQKWVESGELTSESTVRQVIALTKTETKKTNSLAQAVDVLKISYDSTEGYRQFLEIQNELEDFLRSKGIPFKYCGDFSRYDSDMEKYQERVTKEMFRLAKKQVAEALREKIDTSYKRRFGANWAKKISFKEKLRSLGYPQDELDVRFCASLEDLDNLCEQAELNEDGQWDMVKQKLYEQVMSSVDLPASVDRIQSAA